MQVHIAIVQPPPFSQVFHDLARLLVLSAGDLGHDASACEGDPRTGALNIILGHGGAPDPSVLKGHIIYQLEPLATSLIASSPETIDRLRLASQVWDYTHENIQILRQSGIDAKLVPIGFHPQLATIGPQTDQPIDVLHYGNGSPRRAEIVRALSDKCRMVHIQGRFGAERDRYIAAAKIILNVHYFPHQSFEAVRVSYLLNNRRFVISEDSADNPYGPAIVTAPYDRLVETCLNYLAQPAERDRISQSGFESFAAMRMSDVLREALPAHLTA